MNNFPFRSFAFPVLLLVLWPIGGAKVWSQDCEAAAYPYPPYLQGAMDPQVEGWPLSEAGLAYALKPEYERRPGRESNKHQPTLWPVIPAAGFWGGTSWLDTHAKLVGYVQANRGPIDILLVGDSITQQWGSPLDTGVLNTAWKRRFGDYKTINIGIGGDKTQNVLWRLDHGGVEGLQPRLVIVMIGNNNMFFTPETGVEAAAEGVRACADNLRRKFPDAELIVAKILPCHSPQERFYQDIRKTNVALDTLGLDRDPNVTVIDLTSDFVNEDGTLRQPLFTSDGIHLSAAGYDKYAERLAPLVEKSLGGKGLGGEVAMPPKGTQGVKPPGRSVDPSAVHDAKPTGVKVAPLSATLAEYLSRPTPQTEDGEGLVYPYAPYNEGKMDPKTRGWPLNDEERKWVAKGEYYRKPGHEVQKHLPEMWPVTPTAAHWQPKDGGEGNAWVGHHATCVEKLQGPGDRIDVLLIGDSITQGWGGGWDGAKFQPAWGERFGELRTVNLGIGGDRSENVLWRLDHGALDGVEPKVIVLMIGVNNAPLVHANGVPAAAVALGIRLCVDNIRLRTPSSRVIVVKPLPAFDPTREVGAAIGAINAALDEIGLAKDDHVEVLDLSEDFIDDLGSLRGELYSDGHLHLGAAGYEVLAKRLQPQIEKWLKP
jgi:lysophospholipase L1-like esterase